MKLLICFALFFSSFTFGKTTQLRIKNGRSYALDVLRLVETLEPRVSGNNFNVTQQFRGLVANLPQQGLATELGPSIDTMAKWSSVLCGQYANKWNELKPAQDTQDQLIADFFTIALQRLPHSQEKTSLSLLQPLSQQQAFSMCFYVVMSPEFITIRKD